MRIWKAIPLLSVSVLYSLLAAQSAKADDILFNDLVGDTTTLTVTNLSGPNRLTSICPPGGDICGGLLSAPSGYTASVQTITFFLGEGSLFGNISDDFVGALGTTGFTLKF